MSKTDKKPPTGKMVAPAQGELAKAIERSRSAQSATAPVASYETITPEKAAELLQLNKRNRTFIASRLATYTEAMLKGEWRVTHQGISIGADGELYDGQHRLMAVVQSKVTVMMFVTRGLPANAREVIDSGAARSAVDNLAISEGITLHKTWGAALGVIWMTTIAKSLTRTPTTVELRDTMMTHLDGMEGIKKVISTSVRGISRSGFLAAFIYAYPTDPEKVADAARGYYTGAELRVGDPMYTLRDFALRKESRVHTRGESENDFRRALGMIAAYLDGEKRSKVLVKNADIDNSRIVARFAAAHKA